MSIKIWFAGGVIVSAVVGYLYHQYASQNEKLVNQQSQIKEEANANIQNFNLQQQLQKFKSKLNLINPSLQQLKVMLEFSFQITQKQLQRIANQFKKGRRSIDRQLNLKDYFKAVAVGTIRMRQIAKTLQQAVMIDIGVSPQLLTPYQAQLGPFLYQLQMNQALGNKQITLGQVKSAINYQLDFVKSHGNRLVDKIIQYCKDWQIQAKQYIPEVFTVFLADQMYLQHPELQEYDMKGVQKRFGKYLIEETKRMKQQMQPMILRMCKDVQMYSSYSDGIDEEIQGEVNKMERLQQQQLIPKQDASQDKPQ